MIDLAFLESITFARVRVTFAARDTVTLPRYKGSAYRGCLGDALRRDVCTCPGSECGACRQRYRCVFSQLFNSYVPTGHPHVRKYPKSPHPYIVYPFPGSQTIFEPGETFGFELTLIGGAVNLLPRVTESFRVMGETGIGKKHGHFDAVALESLTDTGGAYQPLPVFGTPVVFSTNRLPVPETTSGLTLQFETPLRLMRDGHPDDTPPPFGLLVSRLAARMGLLAHFHCGAPWQEFDHMFAGTNPGVDIVRSQLQRVDWQRYSGTQDSHMNFDGHIGEITYKGDIAPWMPLLVAGSWLHAGSTTTFGLGKYVIKRK